ncbi:MAG: hypothetical protein EAZ21_06025 [Betaproteobacteria bacterium]|nr:MAG: hypothetical protein EAZ21_06025 [Betaproteobacteria bacterium]
MEDSAFSLAEDSEISFGVICGKDIDAVLSRDHAAVRAWAIEVLQTALDRVLIYRSDSHELFHLAVEVLWQFSGGEANESDQFKIREWLDKEHPRGRQWSEFVAFASCFIEDANALYVTELERQKQTPISDGDLPF